MSRQQILSYPHGVYNPMKDRELHTKCSASLEFKAQETRAHFKLSKPSCGGWDIQLKVALGSPMGKSESPFMEKRKLCELTQPLFSLEMLQPHNVCESQDCCKVITLLQRDKINVLQLTRFLKSVILRSQLLIMKIPIHGTFFFI